MRSYITLRENPTPVPTFIRTSQSLKVSRSRVKPSQFYTSSLIRDYTKPASTMHQFLHTSFLLIATVSNLTTASTSTSTPSHHSNPGNMVLLNPNSTKEFQVNDTIEITWSWDNHGNWSFGLIAGEDNTAITRTSHPRLVQLPSC